MKNNGQKKIKEPTPETVSADLQTPLAEKVVKAERQHSGGAFGAVVLISIGFIFLLNNLALLPWEVWGNLWRFWPIFLIVLGLQMVFGRNRFANMVVALFGIALVLGIIAISVANVNESFRNWSQEKVPFWRNMQKMMEDNSRETTTKLEVLGSKYQNVLERELNVDIGSAEFTIIDEESDSFLRVEAIHPENSGKPRIKESFANGKLKLKFDTSSDSGLAFFVMSRREYELFLGQPELPTSVSLDLGSGTGKFDFENLKIQNLKVNQGSGRLDLDLKNSIPAGEFSVDLGSGNIKIDLPITVGLMVEYQIGSGTLTIGDNKIRGEGTFTSQNFSTAEKKLEVKIELGSGNITINH